MARDSNGVYTLPAGNPVQGGTVITSGWANTSLADIETALTDSLDRRGRGGMLAAFKFSDGTAATPGAAWTNEPTTGFFRVAFGDLQTTVLGRPLFRWNSSTVWVNKLGTDPLSPTWHEVITQTSAPTQDGQTLRWNVPDPEDPADTSVEGFEPTSDLLLDGEGNAEVDGTLTATSFVGDGSQLTGISANLADYISRYLPEDQPIFLVAVGQSLMTPYIENPGYPLTPLPPIADVVNSSILEWSSDGLGGGGAYRGDQFGGYQRVNWEDPPGDFTEYDCGYGMGNGAPQNFAWRPLDINKTTIVDGTGGPYTGFTGGGATNKIHGFAVQLHEWTGRDVYILNVQWSGRALSEYFWPFANDTDTEVLIRNPTNPVLDTAHNL